MRLVMDEVKLCPLIEIRQFLSLVSLTNHRPITPIALGRVQGFVCTFKQAFGCIGFVQLRDADTGGDLGIATTDGGDSGDVFADSLRQQRGAFFGGVARQHLK